MAAKTEWTIMLYLSGDNNLSEEMIRTLNEIQSQGVPEGVAFTIQYDPRAPDTSTLRYAVKPSPSHGRIARAPEVAAEVQEKSGPIPIPGFLRQSLRIEDSAS